MKMSKKVLSLLAVLALMGTMLAGMAVTTASADETNLIQNGDFESTTQLEHWRSYWRTREALISGWSGNDKRYTVENESYDGYASVIGHSNGTWDPLYQEVAVTPGKTYQFTAWVKSQQAGGNLAILEGTGKTAQELAGLMDAIYRSESTEVYNYALVFAPLGRCGNWTRVAYEFTPTQSSVVVAYQNNSKGWAWADKFSIVEKTSDNLVANGDFETTVTGLSTGAAAWQAQQGNPNGSKYIRESSNGSMVMANYNTGADALYQFVPVTPGKTYTVSAKLKSGNAGTGFVALEGGSDVNALASDLYYYFNNGTMSTTVLNSFRSTGSISAWTEISFNITPTKSTFVLGYANPTTSWAWIDDVSVVEKNSDLTALGTQIRQSNNALRFGFSAEIAGVTVAEDYNRVMDAATMYIGGKQRTVTNFGVMLSVKADAAEADLTVGATAGSSAQIPADKLYSVEDGVSTFIATLYNIPENMYGRTVSARAYVEYEDETGAKQYIYSDTIATSVNAELAE